MTGIPLKIDWNTDDQCMCLNCGKEDTTTNLTANGCSCEEMEISESDIIEIVDDHKWFDEPIYIFKL